MGERVRATLHRLLPAVAQALEPPASNGDGPAFGIEAHPADGVQRDRRVGEGDERLTQDR